MSVAATAPRKSWRRLTNDRNRKKVAAADPTATSDFPIEDYKMNKVAFDIRPAAFRRIAAVSFIALVLVI
jgi:hypothetical protein